MNKKIKLMSATVLATGAMFLGTVSPAFADVPVPSADKAVLIDSFLGTVEVDRSEFYTSSGAISGLMSNVVIEVEPGILLGRNENETYDDVMPLYEAYKAELAKQNGTTTTTPSTTEVAPTPAPEAPKVEAPKVETPAPEAPKTETPKVETPKVEAPKTETPKVEVKPEAPKTETPKAEAPRVESKDVKVSDKKTENVPSVDEVLKDGKKADTPSTPAPSTSNTKSATNPVATKTETKQAPAAKKVESLPKTGDSSVLVSLMGLLTGVTTLGVRFRRNK